MRHVIAVVASIALVVSAVSIAGAHSRGHRNSRTLQIGLQIEPGFNPNHVAYQKSVKVKFNQELVVNHYVLTNTSSAPLIPVEVKHLQVGDQVTVSAKFTGKHPHSEVSCQRSWPVTTFQGSLSLGCGPVEVSYQVPTNSCVLVCN